MCLAQRHYKTFKLISGVQNLHASALFCNVDFARFALDTLLQQSSMTKSGTRAWPKVCKG